MSAEVLIEIEVLRSKIHTLSRKYGYSHPELLRVSRKLDQKIMECLKKK